MNHNKLSISPVYEEGYDYICTKVKNGKQIQIEDINNKDVIIMLLDV